MIPSRPNSRRPSRVTLTVEGPAFGAGDDVEYVLSALPEWFGSEAAISSYGRDAAGMPVWTARVEGEVVGVAVVRLHTARAAELHVMGVLPQWHGRGVGRALVREVEATLKREGVRFFQVKTVGPSSPDPHYAQTRAFYRRLGFMTLEEHLSDDESANPTVQLIRYLG